MSLFLGINKRKACENLTDKEIVIQYKIRADREMIGILFKRYTHLVYGVCYKYLKDAEESKDAVMDIFEKLTEDLKKHEIENFKSWLYSVSKNHCLMILRKSKPEIRMEDKHLRSFELQLMENDHDMHQWDKEEVTVSLEQMKDSLSGLKEEQRQCLELFYLQNKSYKEIEEITGYSSEKVKSYIQNGKRNMKIILSKQNGEQQNI